MRRLKKASGLHPTVILWMAVGLAGFALLPWYGTDSNFFTLSWLADGYPLNEDVAPALFLALQGQKIWLAPLGVLLLAPLLLWNREKADPFFGRLLIAVGAAGFAYLMLQGFAVGLRGWRFEWLTALFGELDDRQFGMGYGAMLTAGAFLFLFTLGLAGRGAVGGDVFVVGSIGFVVTMVSLFIFMPIVQMLANAMVTQEGTYSLGTFLAKLFSERLWSLGCVTGGRALRRRLEFAVSRRAGRRSHHAARARLRAGRHAHRVPVRQVPARIDGAADHHAAFRHRPRHHPVCSACRAR